MNGDEYMMEGGLYDPPQEYRTDVYLKESGPSKSGLSPLTLELLFVTGNGQLALVDILPADAVRLGKWIARTAGQVMERAGPGSG